LSNKLLLLQQEHLYSVGDLRKNPLPPPRTTLMKEFEDLHCQAVLETAVILQQGIWVQDFFSSIL
jgi:hypothetical protein